MTLKVVFRSLVILSGGENSLVVQVKEMDEENQDNILQVQVGKDAKLLLKPMQHKRP